MAAARNLPVLLVVAALLCGLGVSPPARAAGPPPGVPDLLDPAVQAQFRVALETQFGGDPDFPMLALVNVAGQSPRVILLVIDARNGRPDWSLQEDATIFLMVSDSPATRRTFLDKGFATTGQPSGTFLSGGAEETDRLLVVLRESHRRCTTPVRLVPAAWTTTSPTHHR